jgi:protein transport protein SEC13
VIEFKDNNWDYQMIQAHGIGVNAVSWGPAVLPGAVASASGGNGAVRRFASGGSDCLLKIWEFK